MTVLLKNHARSTLATAVSSVDTLIRVRVGHGDMFPSPTASDEWFPLSIEDESGNIEVCRASLRNGDAISVQRGAEGSQARSFVAGAAVELRLTAGALADLKGMGGSGKVLLNVNDAKLEG
ncbi:tail fiber protein [Erwinia phage Pavtok]|uniref:Putative tail fiber protein n=1 Tax=Erwinia phage Pavtok TaxID=2267655 RepID=A0A345BLX7_9CAUD|nr:tail fiber protein [Erwinia phage Pavtok]AXF51448.1 putative tail fiber protein [Erwinia phage Pavtok]